MTGLCSIISTETNLPLHVCNATVNCFLQLKQPKMDKEAGPKYQRVGLNMGVELTKQRVVLNNGVLSNNEAGLKEVAVVLASKQQVVTIPLA